MTTPLRLVAAAALAAAFSLPLSAAAQLAPVAPAAAAPVQRHHGSHWMNAVHSLNLSPAQRQQIKDAVAQMRAANKTADPQTRRTNRRQLHAQIEGILTPAQRAELNAKLQHR